MTAKDLLEKLMALKGIPQFSLEVKAGDSTHVRKITGIEIISNKISRNESDTYLRINLEGGL